MHTQYLTNEDYEFVFKRTPRLCVDLVIHKFREILMTKRNISPGIGLWHLPGGRVWYKESIDQAIKRIVQSELGLTVTNFTSIGYIEIPADDEYVHSVSIVFKCLAFGKIVLNNQASKFNWFRLSSLPKQIVLSHYDFLKGIHNL